MWSLGICKSQESCAFMSSYPGHGGSWSQWDALPWKFKVCFLISQSQQLQWQWILLWKESSSHHLLFPREGIVPRLADSPLLEVYSCRTGQHTGQSTWHHWTCPVHPVDKLLLFLPPTHSLLQKFRNCLLISALSGSSHINSPLLKSYLLLGLNHVPPKLIFESLLLMALLGDSIIADDLVGESGITVV